MFGSLLSTIASPFKALLSPSGEERNPIRTPPDSSAKKPLTPAEMKKRRVSFSRGFVVEGTTGWDRPVLPGEQLDRYSPKAKKASDKKVKSPAKKAKSPVKAKKKGVVAVAKAKKVQVKKIASKSPQKRSSPGIKVKHEPTRTSRRRKTMKKGFYNEKRLVSLAWSGRGTNDDPIMFG